MTGRGSADDTRGGAALPNGASAGVTGGGECYGRGRVQAVREWGGRVLIMTISASLLYHQHPRGRHHATASVTATFAANAMFAGDLVLPEKAAFTRMQRLR